MCGCNFIRRALLFSWGCFPYEDFTSPLLNRMPNPQLAPRSPSHLLVIFPPQVLLGALRIVSSEQMLSGWRYVVVGSGQGLSIGQDRCLRETPSAVNRNTSWGCGWWVCIRPTLPPESAVSCPGPPLSEGRKALGPPSWRRC